MPRASRWAWSGGRVYVRTADDSGQLQVEWGDDADARCTIDYTAPASADAGPAGLTTVEALCR